ncbi:MAG: type II CAAX endopeptidase family protein [Saccharofermentanaceae bacterium]|nr:type II CAAX endopeptidase family protein [Saccharofermentanaceae bacterium]
MRNRSRFASRFILYPVICVFAYFTVIFVSAFPVAAVKGENYLEYEGAIYLIEGVVGLIAIFIWFYFRKKLQLSCPPCSAGKPLDWVFGTVSALAMLGVAFIYFYLATHMKASFVEKALKDYDDMMQVRSASDLDIYMNVFATCLLIPILEELLFRGIIMEGMLELGRPVLAVVCSSLVFGIMHGQPVQIGYAFLAGMILGAVYYLTGNIVMSILSHIIFNVFGSGIYLLFTIPEKTENVLTIVQVAALVPFAVICVYLIIKRKKRSSEKVTEPAGNRSLVQGRHA